MRTGVTRIAIPVSEAPAALGVPQDTWNAEIAPHIPVIRLGGQTLVAVAELEAWAAANSRRRRPRPVLETRHV